MIQYSILVNAMNAIQYGMKFTHYNMLTQKILKKKVMRDNNMTEITRRKTIADNEVTKEILDKIIGKMFDKFTREEIELTQQNIIKTLLPLKLSNNMIAKVIKEFIPDSNPSAGSVAIQIRNINKKKNTTQQLLDLIEKEL